MEEFNVRKGVQRLASIHFHERLRASIRLRRRRTPLQACRQRAQRAQAASHGRTKAGPTLVFQVSDSR